MRSQEELHKLVDRLGDDQASAALAYVRGLLGARSDLASTNGKDHRAAPMVSGESFFASGQEQPVAVTGQRGAAVVDFDELLGDFWPEDETADEFIAAVRQWRREGGPAGRDA